MKRFKYLALATLVAFGACDEGGDLVVDDPITGSISVTVTAGGENVNATVSLAGPASRSEATGADGAVTFSNLPEGAYAVTIDGFGADFVFTNTTRTVTIDENNQNPSVSFTGQIVETASISGQVVSQLGTPVVGATVDATSASDSGAGDTDSGGSYVISGLRSGSYDVTLEAITQGDITCAEQTKTRSVNAGQAVVVNFTCDEVEEPDQTPSVAIEAITNTNTGADIDRSNVAGLITVQVGVDEGDFEVSQIELLLDGEVVGSQTFSTPVGPQPVDETFEIDFVVNTARFQQSAPFTPDFFNGPADVVARVTANGETFTATETVTLNNSDGLAMTVNASRPAIIDQATGLRWLSGTLTFDVFGIIYSEPFDPNNPTLASSSLSFQSFEGNQNVGTDATVRTFSAQDGTPGGQGGFQFVFSEGTAFSGATPSGIAELITGQFGVRNLNITTVTNFGQVGPTASCAGDVNADGTFTGNELCTGDLNLFFQNELQSGTGAVNRLLRVDNQDPFAGAIALLAHPVAGFSRGAITAGGGWVNHDYQFNSSMQDGNATDNINTFPGTLFASQNGNTINGIGIDQTSLVYFAAASDNSNAVAAGTVETSGQVVATGADLPGESGLGLGGLTPPNTDEADDISLVAELTDLFGNDSFTNVLDIGVDGKEPVVTGLTMPFNDSQFNPVNTAAGDIVGTASDTGNGFSGMAGVVLFRWIEANGETLTALANTAVPANIPGLNMAFDFDGAGTQAGSTTDIGNFLPEIPDGDTPAYYDLAVEAWDQAGNNTAQLPQDQNVLDDFIVDATPPTVSNIGIPVVTDFDATSFFNFSAIGRDDVDIQTWFASLAWPEDSQDGDDGDSDGLEEDGLETGAAAGDGLFHVAMFADGQDNTATLGTAFGPTNIVTQITMEASFQMILCLARFDNSDAGDSPGGEDNNAPAVLTPVLNPTQVQFLVVDHATDPGLFSTESNNLVASTFPTCPSAATLDGNAALAGIDDLEFTGTSIILTSNDDPNFTLGFDPDTQLRFFNTGDFGFLEEVFPTITPVITTGVSQREIDLQLSSGVDTFMLDLGSGNFIYFNIV